MAIKPYIPYIAIGISFVALYFTIRRFFLKSGTKIQGTYAFCSSLNCDDKYIHRIMLENLKDRATTIYSIYLKVGNACYIEVSDFEDNPLILKSFESYQKEFDAIDFYTFNLKRINLNQLIDDKKARKQLYLSTASGKYKVRKPIHRWNPVSEFFSNHLTAIVRPVRANYKGKSYGSNIRYIVELLFQNEKEQIIPIHKTEYRWKSYRDFRITKEALESKTTLEEFFVNLIKTGVIVAQSVTVHDLEEWRERNTDNEPAIEIKRCSWVQYYLIGYLRTYINDRKLRKENKIRLKI